MDREAHVGSELGGYRIERLLGHGGMGAVYLAEHVRLKRKVALKLLASELAEDQRFRDRFLRESQLAASLDDPNVIPIYEAGEQDGVLFIAMRYVDGLDLKALLEQEGPLEPDHVTAIVEQVARALDAAHEKGLVHRDIKPANILVARRGGDSTGPEHVYLTDFGLTKRAASDSGLTGTGVFVGSLNYAAPEQFEGATLDARTDVYALGCVVFECLTGVPPFRKEQDVAMMHAHLHEPPPRATDLRPRLPAGVDGVVATSMAKRPHQRYARAGDLAAALRASLTGATIASGEPRRRRRWWPAIAAVVAIAASAIAFVALTGGEDSPGPTASTPQAGPPPPNSVAEIDPVTGATMRTISDVTSFEPNTIADPVMAVGEGGVWVSTWPLHTDPQFTAVDAATGAVRDRITVPPSTFGGTGVAVGDRTVWFMGGERTGTVSRLNPATLDPLPPIRVQSGEVTDIVLGDEVLWVGSSEGRLTSFDALTGQQLAEIDLGSTPDELGFGAGSVWAMNQLDNQVIQVDPDEAEIVRRIDVGGSLADVAAGDGGVWVLDDLAGTVVQIDPETGAIANPIRVGPAPSAIAVGLGSAWVTDLQDGSIYPVDPQTGAGEPIQVGVPLVAVAVDGSNESLWIGVLDPSG
jgi:serine/threonine protein kinase